MSSLIYNSYKKELFNGTVDMINDTIKVMLVTSSYVQNIDTHTRRSDITNEVVGTGYTAGGKTLTTPTVTQDNTNDKGVFDAVDLSWAASTITARGAVIYKSTGVAADDNLIGYIDFGSDKSSTAGLFDIDWNVLGIVISS